MAYTSTYTGAQIDSAVERALNPDNVAVQNSTRPYQSGAAYTKFTSVDNNIANLQTAITGIQNAQILIGTTDPTTSTEGSIGQFYLNGVEPKLFICTSTLEGYTWLQVQLTT